MILRQLSLQNFRSYTKSEFAFNTKTTLIVGPNTSGKTNLIEAISLLALGKSFRTDKDFQIILFEENVCRVKGEVGETDSTYLEVVMSLEPQSKKYLVNKVLKRRSDFASHLPIVLFFPSDLDIVVGSPGLRRNFLDFVLEQVDREYRHALLTYSKGLRQRNALLERAKETGKRDEKNFEYWDNLLIENGDIITKKREEFIEFVNASKKDIFNLILEYDKSLISKERLLQYKDAEVGAGVTLVGPHRDDICIRMYPNKISPNESESKEIRYYGSRGQQRLTILQLKLLQIEFVEKKLGQRPLLLLDDIFSELDEGHINLVLELIGKQQTIITTTHKEFVPKSLFEKMEVIEIG